VFGARAAAAMREPPRAAPLKQDRVWARGSGLEAGRGTTSSRSIEAPRAASREPLAPDTVRNIMWRSAGLFRSRDELARAAATLESAAGASYPVTVDGARQLNLATVARLIAGAALRREESRGGHYRSDYPVRDDIHWKVHLVDQHHG